MAINVDTLRAGLTDYQQVVDKHVQQLHPEFDELNGLWAALNTEYEGETAAELAASWARTAQWFEEYLHHTHALVAFLEERIEHLKSV